MPVRHDAKRLPIHRGPAAWNAILGPQPNAQILQQKVNTDVAIIGAGFAGLSSARRLIQIDPTLKICVLEAGRIAEGASGRNSGFMIDLPHDLSSTDYAGSGPDGDDAMVVLNRQAIAFAREATEEYAIDPAFFDPVGKVNGAASEAGHRHNLSYARHLDQMGEGHEMLDAAAMHDLTGSRYYRSGLFTPGTVMLQPAGYIRGLASGLAKKVDIFEQTPATSFTRSGDGWQVSTPKGQVNAAKIILANNGHLESFGFAQRRLMHVFLFASMTTELSSEALAKLGGTARWGITPSDPMGTTMRKIDTAQGGHRIITRTCAQFEPDMQSSERQFRRASEVMRRKFDDRFPQLSNARMEFTWAGHLCLTRSGVSVVKQVENGVYSACAQNGLGTARGTLTGIAAAEMAMQCESAVSDYFTAQPEPQRLPPNLLSRPAANLYLRWKEWQARAE